MAARSEITTDKAHNFRFRLQAATGEITAPSEAYETRAAIAVEWRTDVVQKYAPAQQWSVWE